MELIKDTFEHSFCTFVDPVDTCTTFYYCVDPTGEVWARGYKNFFMFNSVEH